MNVICVCMCWVGGRGGGGEAGGLLPAGERGKEKEKSIQRGREVEFRTRKIYE